MPLKRILLFFFIVQVGGCSDERGADSPEGLPESSLPGVYSGVFPCDGCPGIDATLWLRPDGRFFFRQRYPPNETRESLDAYSLGRWSSNSGDDYAIELRGAGPRRIFDHPDRDTLVMRTDSALEHRLTRDPTSTDFSATIRMAGMMRMRGGSAAFTECLTGLVAPVSKGGDFARFRHQYRSAGGQGKPTYVELEGRYSWSDNGAVKSLTIERFITVKANGAC